ncbi:hypothetical protein GH714_039657 [Hevea brasiliensis]|uniref:anthocyanidin 3-O-glucosyltransferase n=1 Tax=Hevea brasiliensis TaxID=3981 RepID=A0A6A6N0T1_HEVBR|nr:hypothetical protein GH714_039657 [Hevea brasiliensis]
MKELAMALEASGKNFIWVVRPPIGFDINLEFRAKDWLPEGFEERIKDSKRGLLVHKWAPQLEILSHKSVSAFLSHCGWNSVLESLSYGVPLIGWPMAAEQFYNVKLLEEKIGITEMSLRDFQSSLEKKNGRNSLWLNLPHRNTDSEEFTLPDFPEASKFHVTQLTELLRKTDGKDSISVFLRNMLLGWYNADGILMNTVEEIDKLGLMYFRKKLADQFGQLVQLYYRKNQSSSRKRNRNRAKPPFGFDINSEFKAKEWLPEGYEERKKYSGRGLLVQKWAPQVEILSHRQPNSSAMSSFWKRLEFVWRLVEEKPVKLDMILARKIELVMNETEKGIEMRRRACEVRDMIKKAIKAEEGCKGSSTKAMDEFLNAASLMRKESNKMGTDGEVQIQSSCVLAGMVLKLKYSLPPNSSIRLLEIPFDSSDHGLPPHTENTDVLSYPLIIRLLQASTSLEPAFRKLIQDITCEQGGHPPLCVIADIFFGWTATVAKDLGVFHAVFSGAGGYGLACYYSVWLSLPHRKTKADEFELQDFKEVSKLQVTQLPLSILEADGTDPWRKLGRPAWAVGPVLLSTENRARSGIEAGITTDLCKEWLDTKPENSVLYISFGSHNTIASSQMMQLAMALEASGKNFIWVVRPPIGFI